MDCSSSFPFCSSPFYVLDSILGGTHFKIFDKLIDFFVVVVVAYTLCHLKKLVPDSKSRTLILL